MQRESYALTTDGWSSLADDRYISLTCHFIDDSYIFQSLLLQTKHMPGSHTGENLLSELENLIKFWNLSANMKPFFVTDNAKNIVNAMILGKFSHIGCFAHILNLAVQN